MRHIIMLFLPLLLLWACEQAPRTAMHADVRQDLQRIPVETNVLVYCDVQALSEAPLGQEVLDNLRRHAEAKADTAELALLDRFLQNAKTAQIVAGLDTRPGETHSGYFLVRGEFDETTLLNLAEGKIKVEGTQAPWHVEEINGRRVFTFEGRHAAALVFLEDGLCAFGTRSWVDALARGEKIPNHFEGSDRVAGLLKKAKYGDQFWAVIDLPLRGREEQMQVDLPPEMNRLKESVQAVVVSARVFEDVRFEGQIECASTDDSQLMVDLLKGGLAAVKLSLAGDRQAIDELNAVKIYQQGRSVVASGTLSKTFFDLVWEHAMQARGI